MIDLSCEDVYKRYLIRGAGAGRLPKVSDRLKALWPPRREFWALRGVSFEVQRGEALGIIGPNGAGKSTILKLLSRITAPSRGLLKVRGRLAAMIEVSAGFHNELTGRENIYLSGAILGMRRSDISRKLESIIECSGLREFVDVPVKRYSTGMYLRLGFAVAAHLETDILLLDEVLAVGDLAFQAKCYERIAELRKSGVTLLMISHDLGTVEHLCDRALLLHQGQIVASGQPRDVIAQYMTLPISQSANALRSSANAPVVCTGLAFRSGLDGSGNIRTGDPMVARLDYEAREALIGVTVSLSFWWPSGYLCAQLTTAVDTPGIALEAGRGCIEFYCAALAMQPGMYRVDASISRNSFEIDKHERCSILRVDPGRIIMGDFYMPHTWQVIEAPQGTGLIMNFSNTSGVRAGR